MGTDALEHRCKHDRRDETARVGRKAGEGKLRRVEHGELACVARHEVLNALGEWTHRIFALEQDDADVLFDQFERSMEEVGGMHRTGADPLHLLENAHAVVEGFRPHVPGAGDDMIVGAGKNLREILCSGFEASLHLQQRLRQGFEFTHNPLVIFEFPAVAHDRKRNEQRLQIE
ncbi:hypothetical protein D9M70_495070 [compost metagenome]